MKILNKKKTKNESHFFCLFVEFTSLSASRVRDADTENPGDALLFFEGALMGPRFKSHPNDI